MVATCPLCSQSFASMAPVYACARCPLAGTCRLLRCPNCGYEWPASSALVDWLRRVRHASAARTP